MQAELSYNIGFIGGGNMASALIAGLIQQQVNPKQIQVLDLDSDKRAALAQQHLVNTTDRLEHISQNDVIVLAIKPQQLKAAAEQLVPLLNQQLIISVAAGISSTALSNWLNQYQKIIRTMPNTPAQIQAGITGLYAMPQVSDADKQTAEHILQAVGQTLWVDSEDKIDAITAISGSGPAYVFYLIEALQAAATDLGLTAAQAEALSLATFKGASLLADASDTEVAQLREQVTSKGGTTEQGLLSLESSKVKEAISRAADKAYQRAQTLGKELEQ